MCRPTIFRVAHCYLRQELVHSRCHRSGNSVFGFNKDPECSHTGQVTLFQFGAGVWSGVLILRAKTFEELQFHSLKVPAVRLTYLAENQIAHADVECPRPGLQRQLFAI
jgi:hypothetical protein